MVARVPVLVIEEGSQTVLVEYRTGDEEQVRVYLPREAVRDGTATPDDLAAGVPVGPHWEDTLTAALGAHFAHVVAQELRRIGIWTAFDVVTHVPTVQGAFVVLWHAAFKDLLTKAVQLRSEEA